MANITRAGVKKRNPKETIDNMIKRFHRKVHEAGVMEELSKREYYVGPSLKRKLKSEAAKRRRARGSA